MKTKAYKHKKPHRKTMRPQVIIFIQLLNRRHHIVKCAWCSRCVVCMNNILLPARIGGFDISKIKEETTELAGILGITHCLSKYPFELSGGEQQRVNIVRSLSLKSKLLLCDEPTGNLDSQNSDIVITLLMELTQRYGSTLVVVTHDRSVAARFKNRFTLRDGKVDSLSVSGV